MRAGDVDALLIVIVLSFFATVAAHPTRSLSPSRSPFHVLIPPQGVLSIYLRDTTDDFESSIFPVYVTNYQPAVLTGGGPSRGRGRGHKIEGRLIAPNINSPTNGCFLDKLPKIPGAGGEGPFEWILLVDNLDCDTATKAANAAKGGFGALLIYNTNSDYEPALISVDAPSEGTAGVYVASIGARDGYLVRSLYAYPQAPQDFYLELEETSFVFIDVLYHLMLICFTITSVFVGLLCASWIYDTCHCQKCVERLDERRKQKLLHAFLAKRTLTRQWSADGPFQNNDSCIICLEEFSGVDQIRVLPCLHVFHVHCIDVWMLRMSMCCPICKQWIGTKVEEMQILTGGGAGDGYEPYQGYGDDESIPLLPVAPAVAGTSLSSPRPPDPAPDPRSSPMESLRSTSASVAALLPSVPLPNQNAG